MRPSKNPHFIPTAALQQWGKQASRVADARKKFSFGQPKGYPTLKLCFLAYISLIYGAAKFFHALHLGEL
ncbi:MAG: hypothetical protein KGL01_05680 [Betaproteobacteria bacterium]|nr:hypothetical protein [Betaproteobacteria bacterium]